MQSADSPLALLDRASAAGDLSSSATAHIRRWLTAPCFAEFAPQVAEHLAQRRWEALEAAFWTEIPFGTAGRRGRMYPIGPGAINRRTIGESAQGLADYLRELRGAEASLSCAVAYDTRHRSREFAELCAEVMAAAEEKAKDANMPMKYWVQKSFVDAVKNAWF